MARETSFGLVLVCGALLWLSACASAGPKPATAPGEEDLVLRFSPEMLAGMLREEGYGSVEALGDESVSFRADGMVYVLLCYEDGDLQLFWGLRGVAVSPQVINEWNRTKRLSRAYLDEDLDPVLESDLLSDAGLTRSQVLRFVQVFVQATRLYEGFLVENGAITQEEPVPAAGAI